MNWEPAMETFGFLGPYDRATLSFILNGTRIEDIVRLRAYSLKEAKEDIRVLYAKLGEGLGHEVVLPQFYFRSPSRYTRRYHI